MPGVNVAMRIGHKKEKEKKNLKSRDEGWVASVSMNYSLGFGVAAVTTISLTICIVFHCLVQQTYVLAIAKFLLTKPEGKSYRMCHTELSL